MPKNKSKHGKVDEKAEHRRARALKRFKDQNPDHAFAKSILPEQEAELARVAGDEAWPPTPSEKDTYPIEWAENKRSFNKALERFQEYIISKNSDMQATLPEAMETSNPPSPQDDDAPANPDDPTDRTDHARPGPENVAPSGSANPAQKADHVASPERLPPATSSTTETSPGTRKEASSQLPHPAGDEAPPPPPTTDTTTASSTIGKELPLPPKVKAEPTEHASTTESTATMEPTATTETTPSPAAPSSHYTSRRTLWPPGFDMDGPAWQALVSECEAYGCEATELEFRLLFHHKHEVPNATTQERLQFARKWLELCPAAAIKLETTLAGDPSLQAGFTAYRASNPRKLTRDESPYIKSYRSTPLRDSSVFSENPAQRRDEIGFSSGLVEATPGWDDITLEHDPDDENEDPDHRNPVQGKIIMSIWHYLDVVLPSLNEPSKERHVLVRRSDYPTETKRFEGTTEGQKRRIRSSDKRSLAGCRKEDIELLNYSSDVQDGTKFPVTYAVGFKKFDKNKRIMAWSRSVFVSKFGQRTIDNDINDERKRCGQSLINPTR